MNEKLTEQQENTLQKNSKMCGYILFSAKSSTMF